MTDWTTVSGPHTSSNATTSYEDTGLTAGTRYHYRVAAVTAGIRTARGPIPIMPFPARSAYRRSTATAGTGQIDLSWNSITGAVHYHLIHWTTGMTDWESIGGNIGGISHTHDNLAPGTVHFYQVRAVNAADTRSNWSNQVSATVTQIGAPLEPSNLAAAFGNQNITFTWAAPTSDGGSAITRYEYRYIAASQTYLDNWTSVNLDLTVTVSGLDNGTEYKFQVRAVNAEGDGAEAEVMETPATVPLAPTLSALAGYRQITLSWTAPTNNGGSAVTGYKLELFSGGNWGTESSSLGATSTSYNDTGLSNNTLYNYRLIAVNKAGDSAPSTAVHATTLANQPNVPGAPETVTALEGSGMVTLNWTPPTFTGGAPITSYDYRYATKPTPPADPAWRSWTPTGADLTVAVPDLTAEVPNLTPGQAYVFQVRAVNSAGGGAGKDATNGTDGDNPTDDIMPSATAPTRGPILRASIGKTGTAPWNEIDQITLTWDQVADAYNGGATITDYELCYKKSTETDWTLWDDSQTGFSEPSATGTAWSALHGEAGATLDPGTTYQYRARALNGVATAGSDCSSDGPWSNMASASTDPIEPQVAPMLSTPPGATNTDLEDSNWEVDVSSITLNWTAPEMDGGAPITGYEIWVGTTSQTGLTGDDLAALPATITNLPATPTEYTHIGLQADRAYYYRVRARNRIGESPWSLEGAAQTTMSSRGTPAIVGALGTTCPTTTPPTTATADDGEQCISWDAPTQGNSPIIRYDLQFQNAGVYENTGDTEPEVGSWEGATVITVPPADGTVAHFHTGLVGGSRYYYRVRAVNATGEGSYSTPATQRDVPDREPEVPDLIASAAGTTQILLEWTAPADNGSVITHYDLQRWTETDAATGAGNWTEACETPGAECDLMDTAAIADGSAPPTLFLNMELDAGETYYYRVRALNSEGSGEWSTTTDTSKAGAKSATTMTNVPGRVVWGKPESALGEGDAVAGAVASLDDDGAGMITLTWTAPAAGGPTITGYEIRVWDGSQWDLEATPAADDESYEDMGLAHGTHYHYIIRASNSQGMGPWSETISARTANAVPGVPALTATPSGKTAIVLQWTAPADNGSPISDYDLERWDPSGNGGWSDDLGPGSDGDLLGTAASTLTLLTDTDGITAGNTYYYRIRATNGEGAGAWSTPDIPGVNGGDPTETNRGAVSASTSTGVPVAPRLTDPASGEVESGVPSPAVPWMLDDDSITLTWVTGDDGGSKITGYELQVWDSTHSRWAHEANLADTARSYEDTGLAPAKMYYYRIRAMNSDGAGAWSAYESASTTPRAPSIPTLTATAISTTEIRLSWTVADDGGAAVTDYDLQKWVNGAWQTTTDLLGTPASTVMLHTNSGHVDDGDTIVNSPGTTYYFRISAQNDGATDTRTSGFSGAVSATTHADVPDAPVLTAEAQGTDEITLSWTVPDHNGSPIVRYELQVWDTTNRRWSNLNNAIPASVTSVPHRSLASGTRYIYRVRAINGAQINSGQGPWSTMEYENTNE